MKKIKINRSIRSTLTLLKKNTHILHLFHNLKSNHVNHNKIDSLMKSFTKLYKYCNACFCRFGENNLNEMKRKMFSF